MCSDPRLSLEWPWWPMNSCSAGSISTLEDSKSHSLLVKIFHLACVVFGDGMLLDSSSHYQRPCPFRTKRLISADSLFLSLPERERNATRPKIISVPISRQTEAHTQSSGCNNFLKLERFTAQWSGQVAFDLNIYPLLGLKRANFSPQYRFLSGLIPSFF